jgi:NTE family protein
MRGVQIGGSVFWDGLFSQNPPVHDLPGIHMDRDPAKTPDEIWVIRVNPVRVAEEPRNIADIQDRRNELAGNVSLGFELRAIRKMNEFVDSGLIRDPRYKHIEIREIGMSDAIARDLDSLSKLDRKPGFLAMLMDHGKRQAEAFLHEWTSSLGS